MPAAVPIVMAVMGGAQMAQANQASQAAKGQARWAARQQQRAAAEAEAAMVKEKTQRRKIGIRDQQRRAQLQASAASGTWDQTIIGGASQASSTGANVVTKTLLGS